MMSSVRYRQVIATTTEMRNGKISNKTDIFLFPVVGRCRSCLDTLSSNEGLKCVFSANEVPLEVSMTKNNV